MNNVTSTALSMAEDIVVAGAGGEAAGRLYSPVTLNQNWSRAGRLLFLLFSSCFGSLINIFFISSFFQEHYLKRFGNLFLTCSGFADLLITAGVMPVSAVVILSGQWDNNNVCIILQIFCITSAYAYVLYFAFAAMENFCKICLSSSRYGQFITMGLGCICIIICVVSIGLAVMGVYLGLDYDYCQREHYGSVYFRVGTTVVFQAMPSIITISCFAASIIKVQMRARNSAQYRRSKKYKRDYAMVQINATAYFIFLASWMPYVFIIHEYPDSSDAVYYNSVAFGLLRAVFVSSLYGIFNRYYRSAYAHFFKYCCCKSSLSNSHTRRRRRRMQAAAAAEAQAQASNEALSGNANELQDVFESVVFEITACQSGIVETQNL